ncbi:MAG: PorV/PorQ family protein [Bacteroidota bacterium]
MKNDLKKKDRIFDAISMGLMRIIVPGILICLLPMALMAGRGDKAGTAGASELLIPIGARGIALNGSALAMSDGLESIYWNPAGIARSPYSADFMFSHMAYFADIGVDYLGMSTNLGDFGRLGFSIKSLSFGKIAITTEDAPDGTGEYATPAYYVIGGTIARLITDHIAFGVNGNYIIENMEKVSATDYAFTIGIQYKGLGGIDNLSVGVVLRNIGPQIQYTGDGLLRNAVIDGALRPSSTVQIEAASNDLPSTIEIGLGYTSVLNENSSLNLTSTFQNNNYSDDVYRFGGEYAYQKFIFFRGGISLLSSESSDNSVFGPSAGVGLFTTIGGTSVNVDYAFQSTKYFSGNHIIAISVGL